MAAVAQGAQTSASTAASPEEVVRQFYHWYLHALNKNKQPAIQQAMLRRWVTREMLRALERARKADRLDADWFLDAQDFDEAWERNINVSKATVRVNSASTLLTLSGGNWTYQLKITLKREDGVWKIAHAENANP